MITKVGLKRIAMVTSMSLCEVTTEQKCVSWLGFSYYRNYQKSLTKIRLVYIEMMVYLYLKIMMVIKMIKLGKTLPKS